MKQEDIFTFKEEVEFGNTTCVYYRLIGTGITILHNHFEETVSVTDRTFEYLDEEFSSEYFITYNEKDFIEEYGGFSIGKEIITIEELVRSEWYVIINSLFSERIISNKEMEKMTFDVKARGFRYNWN